MTTRKSLEVKKVPVYNLPKGRYLLENGELTQMETKQTIAGSIKLRFEVSTDDMLWSFMEDAPSVIRLTLEDGAHDGIALTDLAALIRLAKPKNRGSRITVKSVLDLGKHHSLVMSAGLLTFYDGDDWDVSTNKLKALLELVREAEKRLGTAN